MNRYSASKKARVPRHTSRRRLFQRLWRRISTTDNTHNWNKSGYKNRPDTTTQEPGAYLAIPVQEFRDEPTEEIAVHYVRINRVEEKKATRYRQQEDNIGSAELDFNLDLETLIEQPHADPDLMDLQCCLEDNKSRTIIN